MPGYEHIDKKELEEVLDVFNNGGILFRHGFDNLRNGCYKVKEFEKAFAAKIGTKYALAVTSGTAALRVALAALGIGKGDEVITQCFTFVATVESIVESGATPVCTEVDKTLNMSPKDLERRITSRTKAVIAVHMLGTPARMKEIKEICDKNNLFLIEDTAWGCGGTLEKIKLGNWGDIGTFSFDFAKTITTGEGGMITFKDETIYKKAAAWHDHGHENNPKYPRWEDTRSSSGFNFRMMELQGAIGLAQLKKLDFIINLQRDIKQKLINKLANINEIELRNSPYDSYDTADSLIFYVKSKKEALKCRENLLENNFSTKILPEAYSWHFAGTWEHILELNKAHKNNLKNEFDVSKSILSRAVSLPISSNLDNEKIDNIGDIIFYTLRK